MPEVYDLYAMAHTGSYKKVKAFSQSDLDDANNFTNISSHNKLVRYRDEGKARKGEDFNPSQGPIDPELVMISGGGRSHGSIAIGDGLIHCPSTLPEIKARQSSSAPEIRPRERPVQLAIKVSDTYSVIFLHYIVCASINDYKWSCEWCCRLLYRVREIERRNFWRRRRRGSGSWRRGRQRCWRRRGHGMTCRQGPCTSSLW